MTSEDYVGIDQPPPWQCPNIDAAIKVAKTIDKAVEEAVRELDSDDPATARETLSDAEWHSGDMESALEDLRKATEGVREWGNEWKVLAKNLLDRFVPDWREEGCEDYK